MRTLALVAFALTLAVPGSAQKAAPVDLTPSMPALQALPAKGAEGYPPQVLGKALTITAKNIDTVLDYLGRFDRDGDHGEKWAQEAQAQLVSQSAIADELVAEGDKALAVGIPRNEKDESVDTIFGHISRAIPVHLSAGVTLLQRDYAAAQTNVTGHLADLIRLKAIHTPRPDREAKNREWLEAARKSADAARERLMAARAKDAGDRVKKSAEKAGLRSSSTLDDK